MCDGSWNEIDQLVYNSSTSGASFGTSLFISKSATAWDQSVGYGKYSSAGLFSNHDSSGQCGAASCTAAEQASLSCPAAPLGFSTPSAVALAAGVPASVAGGQGCARLFWVCFKHILTFFLVQVPGIHSKHRDDVRELQARVDA